MPVFVINQDDVKVDENDSEDARVDEIQRDDMKVDEPVILCTDCESGANAKRYITCVLKMYDSPSMEKD